MDIQWYLRTPRGLEKPYSLTGSDGICYHELTIWSEERSLCIVKVINIKPLSCASRIPLVSHSSFLLIGLIDHHMILVAVFISQELLGFAA